MPQFFSSSVPVTSATMMMNGFSRPCYQLSVSGSGTVSAQAVVEGSQDSIGWITIVSLNASGTDYATDGGPVETNWPLMRARLTSVSGTATLHVSL
ncbi:TPA: hypothetical protein SMP42_002620 [Pseudomonas aeruginosa]|nr:hypothetical protein [Pseudomonas aeruginosa]HEK0719539.1 hypothetical protein [Pseudomonas aeruginosa]